MEGVNRSERLKAVVFDLALSPSTGHDSTAARWAHSFHCIVRCFFFGGLPDDRARCL